MKLIFHSNAPWSPTGYGQQTALFLPALKERVEALACSAFYGLEGAPLPWNGLPVLPGIGQTHGNETILEHARTYLGALRNGLVFTLMDIWVLDASVWRQVNTVCWTPVDHEPLPPPIAGFFQASGAVPVAMSRFGHRMLTEAGLEPLYVPHAIDCQVMRPIDKTEARDKTKLPQDAYIVGMVAANKGNPSRKSFAEAFEAFKAFQAQHEEARLYLHTELTGMFDGVHLLDLAAAVGLNSDHILACDQYRAVYFPFSPETMANVYSSLDVLLAPSAGEGFGLPVVEAQACGVPVIVSDFSAQPELCGAGWLVAGQRTYTPLKAWQFRPDVDDITEALRRAYAQSDAARKAMAEKARTFAEGYDLPKVMDDHMMPALEAAEERFKEREPVTVDPVARARKKHAHKARVAA